MLDGVIEDDSGELLTTAEVQRGSYFARRSSAATSGHRIGARRARPCDGVPSRSSAEVRYPPPQTRRTRLSVPVAGGASLGEEVLNVLEQLGCLSTRRAAVLRLSPRGDDTMSRVSGTRPLSAIIP